MPSSTKRRLEEVDTAEDSSGVVTAGHGKVSIYPFFSLRIFQLRGRPRWQLWSKIDTMGKPVTDLLPFDSTIIKGLE